MKFSFNTLVMIMAVVALVAAATWVVPGGEYTRETKNGRTLVVAGSFRAVPHQPQGPGQVLLAPIKGFAQAAAIIAFLFVIGGAFIIACARGILVVASDGRILDSLLHGLSGLIAGAPPVAAAQAMFVTQCVINFFVHSGSGQAALTMPIMAPLADAVGLTRQTAVLAFQFGEGWINPILPTSGVTMGVLGMAKIPWEKWFRWMLPLQIYFVAVAAALLTIAVMTGYR